ncbi:MAG TPA: hypothetical protein VG966_01370 [Hyphomicrobiaceae bacterium]|jgi:hypothetical protein|nr:hypothetical protein [Hyphomicrobiaceae bacterium]
MSVLRIWFLATGAVLGTLLMWSFAPILIPILLVTGGLGVLAAGIVALARRIERRRKSREEIS